MYYTHQEIEEMSDSIIRDFFKAYKPPPEKVDINCFVTNYLNLSLVSVPFADSNKDCMGFTSDGITPLWVYYNGKKTQMVYPPNTIVVDSYLDKPKEKRRKRFTVAHEAGHYIFDKDCGGENKAHFYSSFDGEKEYTLDDLKQIMGFCENQANEMAASLLMPRFLVVAAMKKHSGRTSLPIYGANLLSYRTKNVINQMADTLEVSYSSLLIRLKRLNLFEQRTSEEYVSKILKFKK